MPLEVYACQGIRNPDRLIIDERVQQGHEFLVRPALELIAGEPACDPGDEVGELNPSITTRVNQPDIHKLPARLAGGERHGNVGYAFRGQRGLFVMYDGDGFGAGAPELDSSGQRRNQRLQ